jgi:50S ribosomal subunit-associated GTPase HflX
MFQTTNQVVIMTMLTTKQFFNQSKTIKKHVLNHYELILTHEFPMNSP